MPLYEVTLTGPATVSTTYRIEAGSEEEAIAKAKSGDHPCESEEIMDQVDQEEDVVLIEPPPPSPTTTEGPHS